jgi:ammonium transporter, Amt family
MLLDFKHDMLTTAHQNAPGVPLLLFCMYQCMFASITPALISGSMAERCRFRTYCVFVGLWMLFVYCPCAHIVWHPEGFLYKLV